MKKREQNQLQGALAWAAERRTLLGGIALLALLVAIGMGWWSDRTHISYREDYEAAPVLFAEVEQAVKEGKALTNVSSLSQLVQVLDRHPDLQDRYDGELAELYLIAGEPEHALLLAKRALFRLSEAETPFYEDFSKTSLLIAQGRLHEAMERAEFLQEKMTEERGRVSEELSAYNQVRIALLAKSLGDLTREMLAWRGVEESGAEMHFEVDHLQLADYIALRKKELRK